jgi:hypothetical protein
MASARQKLAPGAELETRTVNGSSREKSKSSRLVLSTGGAGLQPPRAYFNLDWSLKRGSPLWVISGHVRLCEKGSALPLKADILRDD